MAISWRDRLMLLNGVLFCILGAALIVRYALQQVGIVGALLGVGVLTHGGYRLYLAGKELRRRAAGSGGG